MKRILVGGTAFVALALGGCAGSIVKDPTTGAVTVDVTKSDGAVATHSDLQAAAAYAAAHGYAARAAVWQAEDAKLTAIETQISACANSIAADLALLKPAPDGTVTPFLAVEMGAEAVGNFTGASAKTKILCAAFPVVIPPALPKF